MALDCREAEQRVGQARSEAAEERAVLARQHQRELEALKEKYETGQVSHGHWQVDPGAQSDRAVLRGSSWSAAELCNEWVQQFAGRWPGVCWSGTGLCEAVAGMMNHRQEQWVLCQWAALK